MRDRLLPKEREDGRERDDWAKVRGCKDILGTWRRYKEAHDQDFNPRESYVSRHGVNAASLLGVLTDEHFARLSNMWTNVYGGCAKPEDFLQLFRTVFMHTNIFDEDGMFIGPEGATRLRQNNRRGLSDVENYIKELFVAVDVDKHGMVTWEDFVNYLIANIMCDSGAGPKAPTKKLSDSTYMLDNTIVVGTTRKAEFTALRFYPTWNKVVATGKKQVAVIDCVDLSLPDPAKLYEHDAAVLATAYNSTTKHLVTASSDFKINAWSTGVSPIIVKDYSMPVSAKSLAFDTTGTILYVGDRAGMFHVIDYEKLMTAKPSSLHQNALILHQNKFHSNSVSDMIVLPNNNVVTVGLDSRVQLVNPARNYLVTAFDAGVLHKHGVFSVQHAEAYHFLVTTGLEPFALIWVDNMPNIPSFKLSDPTSPHAAPLCGACAIPGTPNVITVDTLGVTKVFDIRSSQMIESFHMKSLVGQSEQDLQVNCVLHTGNRNRQLIYGSKGLYVFEHESKSSEVPRMAHTPDQPLVHCRFLPNEGVFATVSSKEMRLWSSASGNAERTFTGITPTSVTSAVVDPRSTPKALLGHADGKVTVVNAFTGNPIRTYHKHNSPVVRVALDSTRDLIGTASQGGLFCLWSDLDPSLVLRSIMPTAKKALFSTFNDEVQATQNPLTAFGKLWSKKKEGEQSDAALAAANKMKRTLAARTAASAYHEASSETMPLNLSKGKPRASNQGSKSGHEPIAKLSVSGEIRTIDFCKQQPRLLLVLANRVALVYDIVYGEGISLRLAHKIGHPPSTELSSGQFHSESFVFTTDLSGLVHFWCLHFSKAVCLCRWYVTQPPRVPPRSNFVSDVIDDNVPDYSQFRSKDTARDILAALAKPGVRKHAQKSVVVPSVSVFTWDEPYLYTANEMGTVACWELSPLLNLAKDEDFMRDMEDLVEGRVSHQWLCGTVLPYCVTQWSAHSENVLGIDCLALPYPCIVTFSSDSRVRLWSRHGVLLASLKQGPLTTNNWGLSHERAARGVKALRSMVLWQKLRVAVCRGLLRGEKKTHNQWGYMLSVMRSANSANEPEESMSDHPSVQGRRHSEAKAQHSPKFRARAASPRSPADVFRQRHLECCGAFEELRNARANALQPPLEEANTTAGSSSMPSLPRPRKAEPAASVSDKMKMNAIVSGAGEPRDRRLLVSQQLLQEMRGTSPEGTRSPATAPLAAVRPSPQGRPLQTPHDHAHVVSDGHASVRVKLPPHPVVRTTAKPRGRHLGSVEGVSWAASPGLSINSLDGDGGTRVGGWAASSKFLKPALTHPQSSAVRRARIAPILRLQDPEQPGPRSLHIPM